MLAINHHHRTRLATDHDHDVIERIAALDSSTPIEGAALIGEIDGIPVAVLSLTDGRVVADPFRRTADLVAVMHRRASGSGIASRIAWRVKRLRAAPRRPGSAYAGI